MPHSVESLRDQIRRETLARSLASGRPLDEAAKAAGLGFGEARALAAEAETLALVRELAPEVADGLEAQPPAPKDPLQALEGAVSIAVETLVDSAHTTQGAKTLVEMALKMRAAAQEAPAHVTVQLPQNQVKPLLAAVEEFNALLRTLIEETRE